MKRLPLLALLCTLLAFTACTRKTDSIVIALEPDRDPDAILADGSALRDFISNIHDVDVELVVPLSSAVIREGFLNGTIDIAYVNSTAAARLGDSAKILLATEIEGKPYYESYWLSLKDKPYNSVEDLRGQPIAFSSRTSTSGFIIPMYSLLKSGLATIETGPEGYFGRGNVHFGIGYVSAVERVFDGSAEAAAVSYYVYEKDKHLSKEQRDRLKVVDRQGPVPTHVLAMRASLEPEVIEKLQNSLLRLNKEQPELRDRLFGAPLIKVDTEEHLKVTKEALQLVEQIQL